MPKMQHASPTLIISYTYFADLLTLFKMEDEPMRVMTHTFLRFVKVQVYNDG
jgi:hypothetical protein